MRRRRRPNGSAVATVTVFVRTTAEVRDRLLALAKAHDASLNWEAEQAFKVYTAGRVK